MKPYGYCLFPIALLVVVVSSAAPCCLASESQNSRAEIEKLQRSVDALQHDQKNVAHDLEILRRDQLNYKVEKDLLKETYSSNLQTINLVLSIVLGLSGVLGYLGLRNIKEIKNDYDKELDSLREIEREFKDRLKSLVVRQNEFEKAIEDLSKTNAEQNTKIQILELIEKIESLIREKNWKWALKWVSSALDLDPNNFILLAQKSVCHGKLGQMDDAISATKAMLKIEPDSETAILNLLEYLALSGRAREFEEVLNANEQLVAKERNGSLRAYLEALLVITNSDVAVAKQHLQAMIKTLPLKDGDKVKLLEPWSFDDARAVRQGHSNTGKSYLLEKTIDLFAGQIGSSEFQTAVEKASL